MQFDVCYQLMMEMSRDTTAKKRDAEGFSFQVMAHLVKYRIYENSQTREYWEKDIDNFRKQLRESCRDKNGVIPFMEREGTESAYKRMISWYGFPKMVKKYPDFPSKRNIHFPESCPWTIHDFLGETKVSDLAKKILHII